MAFYAPANRGESTRVVQKSRFLGIAVPVMTEEEATAAIAEIAAANPTCSALAYAYIIDVNVQRFSDGGEPSGTAGMPILSVLQKRGLTRCLCVVVRWFGGIKLGAGGLARAFSGCGIDALENAGIAHWCETVEYEIRIPYTALGLVEHRLADCPYERLDTLFLDAVILKMRVRAAAAKEMLDRFDSWTNGEMLPTQIGEVYEYPWEEESPSV